MASEQKGCQQGSFGAKDHLLINKLLTEGCKARHRSLSMAWVDYQKAYDSVPHSWVLQCLQLHKISPVLCRFLSRVMEGWRTSMVLSHGQGTVKTRIMQIRRGIFQGDSLSPLLFCMALNPLSTELNRTGCGHRMSTGNGRTAKRQLISHLLYMDDLKLYGRNPDQLDGLLHTVRTFSDDIRMKFGLDKCAIAHFVNGKLSGHNTGVKVGKTETIKGLEPGQVYKYLGVDESNGIQHSTMRERLRREDFRRVKMVLRTELYGRNKVLAINGLALPVLTYSFGVIHWRTTDLQQLDRRTRKLLTMHGVHHPSAEVDRLYAPCNEGGRGLQQIEAMYSLALSGWNVISVIVPIRICSLYMSVTLEDPGTRSRAWLVALLHSCGGIWLKTTRRRACTEVGPWHLTVSSSKRLRWMQNISACATVLFVCGHGAGNLCTVSIAVSLSRPLVG